jgi:NADPH-dependent 2,4-dienoyl-CoA reductase/sulfur reductase-like enzyme
VAAGMSAASKARRIRPDIDILVFEKGDFVSYGSCGLPYFLSNMIKSPKDLVAHDTKYFKEKRNIEVFLNHEVTGIHPNNNSITVKNLETREEKEYQYSKLLIATGARAVTPPIEGIGLKGIFSIRGLEDGIAAKDYIKKHDPKNALIVGAGHIGLEIAEAFVDLGMKVTIVERMPNILGIMDEEINEIVENELRSNNVTLFKSTSVTEFMEDKGIVRGVTLDNGELLYVDIAIIGAGIRPNSEIASKSGIELGLTGAIKVNQNMETNIHDIYAAGDCAEAYHRLLKKPVYIPLGTTAVKQGRIAGENMVGGNAIFKGIVGTGVFKVFNLEVAKTGISEKEAENEGLDFVSNVIEHISKAHYYPGGSKIKIKLIADAKMGRLLGAEMVGREGVSKRIDIFATAITAKMTVSDIEKLDLSYAPPFAPVSDPILIAANEMNKKLRIELG